MKFTMRQEHRGPGLESQVKQMFESVGVKSAGRGVNIRAGILDGSRRSAGTTALGGGGRLGKLQARKVLQKLTNATVASLMEYGTSTAPARPFIGPTFKKNRGRYLIMITETIMRAQREHRQVRKSEWNKIGAQMKKDIKDYVLKGAGVPPPNADSTIAKKGSSRPLVDSRQMISAVDYSVTIGRVG